MNKFFNQLSQSKRFAVFYSLFSKITLFFALTIITAFAVLLSTLQGMAPHYTTVSTKVPYKVINTAVVKTANGSSQNQIMFQNNTNTKDKDFFSIVLLNVPADLKLNSTWDITVTKLECNQQPVLTKRSFKYLNDTLTQADKDSYIKLHQPPKGTNYLGLMRTIAIIADIFVAIAFVASFIQKKEPEATNETI